MKQNDKILIILKELFESNEYVTVNRLASISGYSSRSIYSLLSSNSFQRIICGAIIEKKQNKGIKLIASTQQRSKISAFLNNNNNQSFEDPENEASSILNDEDKVLIYLLSKNTPITIEDLSSLLFRSKSSVYDLLDSINLKIVQHGLSLSKRQGFGITLNGLEEALRSLYLNILIDSIYTFNFRLYQQDDKNNPLDCLSTFFNKDDIDFIHKLVNGVEINLNTAFVTYDYYLFTIELLILLKRIKLGYSLQTTRAINKNIQEYYSALFISMMINEHYNIQLSDDEIIHIEDSLLSLRRKTNQSIIFVFDEKIVDAFISLVSERLNIDLTTDTQLKNSLVTHLKPAMRRMKYNITSINPLLDIIKEKYTDIYITIITTIEKIEEQEQIFFDSNEIGYLCLHIAAAVNRAKQKRLINTLLICDSGITFESYLKSLVELTFPTIGITQICSYKYFSKEDLSNYQLILNSTNMIISNDKTINIDVLLQENSCERINNWLNNRDTKDNDSLLNQLEKYLLFFSNISFESQHEFIQTYCAFLVNNGYTTEAFQKSVEKRIEKATTTIGKGIAVPHGSIKYVKKSIILAVKLTKPIKWEDDLVDFVFFAVIGNDYGDGYSKIFRKIMRIVSNDEDTYKLKTCKSIDEIKQLLTK